MNLIELTNIWNQLNDEKKYEIKSVNIESLLKLIENNELIFDSKYQRESDVWNETDILNLITSLSNGYPIPAIYIYFDDENQKFSLLDGLQRMTSLKKASIHLSDITKGTISNEVWNEIEKMEIPVIIFKSSSNKDEYSELFDKINTTGSKANNQEIRRSKFQNSKIRKWIFDNDSKIKNFSEILMASGTRTFSENQMIRQQIEEFILWLILIEDSDSFDKIGDTNKSKLDEIYQNRNPLSDAEWDEIIKRLKKINNILNNKHLEDYWRKFKGKAQIFNLYSMLKFNYILNDSMNHDDAALKLCKIMNNMKIVHNDDQQNSRPFDDGFKIARTTIQEERLKSIKTLEKFNY